MSAMVARGFRLRVSLMLIAACAAAHGARTASAQLILDKGAQNPDRTPGRPAVQPNFTGKAIAPWPRLDPGAVVCTTRDDLERHHRAMEARVSGQAAGPPERADCRVVGLLTPIDVVSRASPAATEIRLKGSTQTAWTDTWLPSQPPR